MLYTESIQQLEASNFRSLGAEHCQGGSSVKICTKTSKDRRKTHNCKKYYSYVKYFRRNKKIVGKRCYRISSSRSKRAGLLQHFFRGFKKGRGSTTDSKPKTTKSISREIPFQDGNFTVNYSSSTKGRLGVNSGFKRCLPSNSNVSCSQEVSKILYSGCPLSVSSNAFRDFHGTQGVYESNGHNRGSSSKSADSHFHVSGRLACQKPMQTITSSASCNYSASFSGLGIGNKSRQVSPSTLSNDNLFRGSFRPEIGVGFPIRNPFPPVIGNNFGNCSQFSNSSFMFPSPFGTHGFMYRHSALWPFAYAPYSNIPFVFLAPSCGQFNATNTGISNLGFSPSMVATERQCFQGCPASGVHIRPNSVDRCIQVGMGGSFREPSCIRSVASSVEGSPYQLARNESSMECFGSISGQGSGSQCSNQVRQLNSLCLHQSSRRNEINSSLHSSLGNDELVYRQADSSTCGSYSGEKELLSGQIVQGPVSHTNNGVEFEKVCSLSSISDSGDSQHRLICHKRKQSVGSVLQSLPRSISSDMRCAVCGLVRDVCLCLSTPNSHTKGVTKNQERRLSSSVSSSDGSKSILVSTTDRTVGRNSIKTSCNTRSSVSKQGNVVASKSKKSRISSMENIKKPKSAEQFSKQASDFMEQSVRVSTRKLYSVRWDTFCRWCTKRHIDPFTASITSVADFLVFLHTVKKFKVPTIIGYRSAINSKHKGWENQTVGTSKHLSKLIKGIFNVNPTVKPLLPNWDLPSVLWRLCDFPFEPLLSCDFKFLTWKTVFLLALASASRVSELHALSVQEGNFRYERNGIRLLPNLQFLSKTQRLNKPWNPIFIPRFDTFATEEKDLLLCPFRALKMYIKRTDSRRKEIESENVFLTYQKGVNKSASKDSIARWIVSLIKYVYEDLNKQLDTVRAHDTRKLSTSWALFNGATISEIIKAAHWASDNTFTSFYMKDVPTKEARFARAAILDAVKQKDV